MQPHPRIPYPQLGAVWYRQRMDLSLGFDLLVAALAGLAVGLEREWSGHTVGPDGRFAGLRTFTLLALMGGIGGWLMRLDHELIAACIVAGAILFPNVAYGSAMKRPGTTVDGTTEVSAMLVVAIGVASGSGHRTLASAVATLVVVLLAEKSALQSALKRLDVRELRATAQFAVMALVILPILPNGSYGPYGAFQPRQLWTVVLLFSALNFAGYVARRVIGETRGLGVTGLLGGLVSSTAVSLNFSRRSRIEPALSAPLALGVAAACTMLLPRILVIASGLERALLPELLPLLTPPFLAGVGVIAVALWQERTTRPEVQPDVQTDIQRDVQPVSQPAVPHGSEAEASATPSPAARNGMLQNPLAVGTSLQMAIAFQLVLFIIAWIQATVGNPGVLASAALLGLTDMDALTLSMTRLAGDASQAHVAAMAIGIGVTANSVLKLLLVLVLGSAGFRVRAGAALLILGVSGTLTLWWRW